MIGAWNIHVGGRSYGPYSSERMLSFAAEGRLGPRSLIARDGSDDWHEAWDEPEFAALFPAKQHLENPLAHAASPGATEPEQDPEPESEPEPEPDPEPESESEPRPVFGAALAGERPAHEKAQFAVIVDLKSRAPGKLDQTIMSLGPAYKLLPNVWIVTTDQSVNAVRNRLVQELGKLDMLFVVDATRGKAAWFNFGPEADVRIRKVWQKAG